ncbi:MAG: phosphoribosyl-ATP diphosphatase, partial [Pseudolabrys sp.]
MPSIATTVTPVIGITTTDGAREASRLKFLEPQFSVAVNRLGARIGYGARMTDSVARLHAAVIAVRGSDPTKSRTARLLRSGRAKMAKKLAEEAVEVVIDAMHGQTEAVVRESADLIYNLVVLW